MSYEYLRVECGSRSDMQVVNERARNGWRVVGTFSGGTGEMGATPYVLMERPSSSASEKGKP